MYQNNMDHHSEGTYMGLDNQICENPKYYCKNHLVYLSEEDVQRKKCTRKPTFDMIGTTSCRSLMTLEAYQTEMNKHKENIAKINESRKNAGMSSYTRDYKRRENYEL